MGWNDSDNNNDKKDPWSGKKQGPPDLDEAFRNLQKKIRGAMKGNKGGSSDDGGAGFLFGGLAIVALIFWILSGIFIVGAAEQAAVLRFGKFVETVGPGPHWIPRFIDTKIIHNVDQRSKYTYSAQMLTKDENIVQVSISVIYRIGNLENYLFNVTDPIESLKQATASSLRQVVGHTTLDDIITKGRELWGSKVETLLSGILKDYKTGLVVVNVSPQPARAPEKVQDAFDDAITAQEDEKRFMEKARSYQEKVLPIARGRAERLLSEAQADAEEWVLQAEGAVAKFVAILPQYQRAAKLVRQRMYINTIEEVLSQTSKILVDGKSGNMLYLPLDKILSKSSAMKNTTSSSLDMKRNGSSFNADDLPQDTPSNNSSVSLLRQTKSQLRSGSRF